MVNFNVVVEFEKPSPEYRWTAERTEVLVKQWDDLRAKWDLKGMRTQWGEIQDPSVECWSYYFVSSEETPSKLFDMIEEGIQQSPVKVYYKAEPVTDGKEFLRTGLALFEHVQAAPIADLLDYVNNYTAHHEWIKDAPAVPRSIMEHSTDYWKASLYYGDLMVALASVNLLNHSRKDELYDHLKSLGYDMDGVAFSWVAKTLNLWVDPKEVPFAFNNNYDKNIIRSAEIQRELAYFHYMEGTELDI